MMWCGGVGLLRRIAPAPEPTELERFREAFTERYEDGEVALEVPLLEALDDDLGVGFGGGGDPAPLLKGLVLPRSERQATMGRRERRLLELMHRAWALGALEVSLRPGDIAELERDDALPLPGAVGAMASLARTREGLRVLVPFAGGPPGARLLGRFCHADPALDARVRGHLRAEEALEPGLDNTLSVDALVRLTRRRDGALIEELYPGPEDLIAEAADGHRALEL
jgi:class I lanthipeptide synthase